MSVDIAAIRAAVEMAGWQHRLKFHIETMKSTGRCTVCDNPWPCYKAFREEDGPSKDDLLALCDLAERALPTPPLAEDVQAALAMLTATHTRWANYCEKCGRTWPCETATIITALHAATAERATLTGQNAAMREALVLGLAMRRPGDIWSVQPSLYAKFKTAAESALADPNPRAEALLRLAADPDVQVMEELLALPGLERVCWDRGEWDAEWRVNGKLYGEEGYLSPVDLLAAIREKVKGE